MGRKNKQKETQKKEEGRTWFWSSKSRDDAVVLTQSAVCVWRPSAGAEQGAVPRPVEHTASDRLLATRSICTPPVGAPLEASQSLTVALIGRLFIQDVVDFRC